MTSKRHLEGKSRFGGRSQDAEGYKMNRRDGTSGSWNKSHGARDRWSGADGASNSRRASDSWNGNDGASDAGGFPIHGVTVQFVCGSVPVLDMDTASVFDEEASWMLQSALDVTAKANTLYEYVDDADVMQACRNLGLRKDDICLVRCLTTKYRHIRAVGVSGKRSVMIALVIALALDDENGLDDLWDGLMQYRLNRSFDAIIRCCQQAKDEVTTRNRRRSESRRVVHEPSEEASEDEASVEGVTVQMVNGDVPVVSMDKTSIFDECASWLLQIAANSTAKATSLYDYANDDGLMDEIRRLGKNDDEILIARLTGARRSNIFAAGDGKRAVMVALALALILRENMSPHFLAEEARQYQDNLEQPCRDLALMAMRLQERQTRQAGKRKRVADTFRQQKQPRARIDLRQRPVLQYSAAMGATGKHFARGVPR